MAVHSARSRGGLGHIIETRLEGPVFAIVASMLVIRSAQAFSGGVLVMAHLLGPRLFPTFQIVTGLGLGLGSELLMTLAGRSWRSWGREATELAARPGMSRAQRTAYVAQARAQAHHSWLFMWIGAGASLYTSVSYLITNAVASGAAINWGALFTDVVSTAVITAFVLYVGVLREHRTTDETQEALAHLQEGMDTALDAAVGRFSAGTYSDIDVRLIGEHLPPNQAAKFRRAVAKQETGRTWTAAQIRAALGIGSDARAIRELNRAINKLAADPQNGLDRGPDGRTWAIPHRVVMEQWGEDIATYTAMRKIGSGHTRDSRETEIGQLQPIISALP